MKWIDDLRSLSSVVRNQGLKIGQDMARYGTGNVVQALAQGVVHHDYYRDHMDLGPRPAPLVLPDDPALSGLRFTPAAEGLHATDPGRNPKQVMVDQHGDRWLFKTALPGEEWKVLGDVAGSRVLDAIGVKTPQVYVSTQPFQGRPQLGTLQRLVPADQLAGDLPGDLTKLTAGERDDLVQAHVARWLIADHDTKPGNFLALRDGHAEAIDLGSMYRMFGSDRLSRHYQETPSAKLYVNLFGAYANGELDLDLSEGMRVVDRIERLDPGAFKAMLRPYAEARYAQGQGLADLPTPEAFLDAAAGRKASIRQDVTGFYEGLARERGLPSLSAALAPTA